MNIARVFVLRLSDAQKANGFHAMSPLDLAQKLGGQWDDCRCGSEHCPRCNGSVDAYTLVRFPDASAVVLTNPREACFPAFVIEV